MIAGRSAVAGDRWNPLPPFPTPAVGWVGVADNRLGMASEMR